MLYEIQNDALRVTVSDRGAELWALEGADGTACLWDAQPEVWPWHAPVCFPWCGALEEGWSHGGQPISPGRHGLVRDLEHTLVEQTAHRLRFRLRYDGPAWPWPFTFETVHALEGADLVTTCTAVNQAAAPMPVQLGFHTGLRCPFSPLRRAEDYLIRFSCPEAPGGGDVLPLSPALFTGDTICLTGLHSQWLQLEERDTGRALRLWVEGWPYGGDVLPLSPALFTGDTICLTGLHSQWLQLEERDTGRALRLWVEGWPYVLLWSQPGLPGFVCIEPWTGYIGPGRDLMDRPGTLLLPPGQALSRTQRLSVQL